MYATVAGTSSSHNVYVCRLETRKTHIIDVACDDKNVNKLRKYSSTYSSYSSYDSEDSQFNKKNTKNQIRL